MGNYAEDKSIPLAHHRMEVIVNRVPIVKLKIPMNANSTVRGRILEINYFQRQIAPLKNRLFGGSIQAFLNGASAFFTNRASR